MTLLSPYWTLCICCGVASFARIVLNDQEEVGFVTLPLHTGLMRLHNHILKYAITPGYHAMPTSSG